MIRHVAMYQTLNWMTFDQLDPIGWPWNPHLQWCSTKSSRWRSCPCYHEPWPSRPSCEQLHTKFFRWFFTPWNKSSWQHRGNTRLKDKKNKTCTMWNWQMTCDDWEKKITKKTSNEPGPTTGTPHVSAANKKHDANSSNNITKLSCCFTFLKPPVTVTAQPKKWPENLVAPPAWQLRRHHHLDQLIQPMGGHKLSTKQLGFDTPTKTPFTFQQVWDLFDIW